MTVAGALRRAAGAAETIERRTGMGKTLVLAEKPSVGRDIARVLGARGGGEGMIVGEEYIVS